MTDDDGGTWRPTRNWTRCAYEHYKLHNEMPSGISSDGWPRIKAMFDAAIAAEPVGS